MNRNIHDLTTATAYDRDGEKLGSVKEVYINDSTGQPDFVEVGHGLFGMSSSIVPLRGHRLDGEDLQLAFTKDRIQDAPNISGDDHLSEEDHATIYRHFGLDGTPNETEYEPHRFDDDYDRDSRDLHRDDYARDDYDATPAQGMPGDQVVAPGVAGGVAGTAGTTGAVPEGTDVHGFGDHRRDGDASADRLRADSDHELGLDRTPEDRAARGTSAHGMSDEPREQLRDYE
ncbi:PRC-barrel domain-containing protein, partial [Corynebacterium sp.]|uniref:PRC-barrel domain-containing protein n=1 Tax=Corynebacterium sp. TaxID=1720 RepID=UPI0026DEC15E